MSLKVRRILAAFCGLFSVFFAIEGFGVEIGGDSQEVSFTIGAGAAATFFSKDFVRIWPS
jgi:hypothetical protein